jgi:hypothetical protein
MRGPLSGFRIHHNISRDIKTGAGRDRSASREGSETFVAF